MSGLHGTEKKWTYADYYSWNDKISEFVDRRCELIDGVEYGFITPTPPPIHQAVSMALVMQFSNHLDKKRHGCKVYMAPLDVCLPDTEGPAKDDEIFTVVQPDILVVCDPAKLLDERNVTGAPDLVVEISSPVTAGYDLTTKFDLYERVGVEEYWIVQPVDKTLMIFKLDHRSMTFDLFGRHGGRDRIPVPLLGDLVIDLEKAFED